MGAGWQKDIKAKGEQKNLGEWQVNVIVIVSIRTKQGRWGRRMHV